MKLLSVEAAITPASVALNLDGTVVESICDDPKAQAESVLGVVEHLLEEHEVTLGELDGLAVGRGPGSFTGLRVAAALVQGLAYSANKKVANVSSLESTAYLTFLEHHHRPSGVASGHHHTGRGPLLVCLDARKSQVYCALYEFEESGRIRTQSDETVADPSDVVEMFAGRAVWGTGNGFDQYPELGALSLETVVNTDPSARAIALLAASGNVSFDAPYLATPEYVRNNVTHGS